VPSVLSCFYYGNARMLSGGGTIKTELYQLGVRVHGGGLNDGRRQRLEDMEPIGIVGERNRAGGGGVAALLLLGARVCIEA
jgi:hypothetical protein